ncbi:hypothetical protein CHS0354_028163 [Potamilus streckersoni]|uniref:Uncharacterized protein n=1 Tax=Potamilus streckersoni TaxID=2493646 RepID=A0AAE0TI22_9BIVA|nr:hypothetical protein CHS0354_028163 [Potamilus streckersoni]
MTTLETRIIEHHNYKTLFGPCFISFSIPILIPGLTLTFIGIYGNDTNFPKFGGWHIAGIVILSFAVVLLIIGIILRCIFRPLITPDIEAHLTPAHSIYGRDNQAFTSKERIIETMNNIYKGPPSDKHEQMRAASPRPDGRQDSSRTREERRDSKLVAAFVHGSPARRSSRESSDNTFSKHSNPTKPKEEDSYKGVSTAKQSEDFLERPHSTLDHYQDNSNELARFKVRGNTKENNQKQSSETVSKANESVIITIDKNGRPVVQKRDNQSLSDSKHSNAVFKEMENSLHKKKGERRNKRPSSEEDVDMEDSVMQAEEIESTNTEKHEGLREKQKSRRQSKEVYLEKEVFAQDASKIQEERRERQKSKRQSKDDYFEKEVFVEDAPELHDTRRERHKSRRKSRDEYTEKEVFAKDPDSSSRKDKSLYSEGIRQTKHKRHRNSSTMSSDELILGSSHATTTVEATATVHAETIGRVDTHVHSSDLRTDEETKASVRKLRKKKKKRKSILIGDQEITELETVPNINIHSYETTEQFPSPVMDTGKEESVQDFRKNRLKKELSTSNISQDSLLAQYMMPT